jgi:hypothetical protein
MSPCQPVHQNSDARDMAAAAVNAPMMEPELGSTNASSLSQRKRPVGLVGDRRMRIESIQQRQSGLGPVDFGMRSRARHGSAD